MRGARPATAWVLAAAALPGGLAQDAFGAKTCVGDYCTDLSWCPAKHCAAYNLGVPFSEKDHPDMTACRHIKMAAVKKLDKATDTAYCVSQDATPRGFQCFRGTNWYEKLVEFLYPGQGPPTTTGGRLNETACESVNIRDVHSGVSYVGGYCCVGAAVPCDSDTCSGSFEPLGPTFTNSLTSIMLGICAIVHLMSCGMCIVFADRLISDMEVAEGMTPNDKKNFKNIIAMLGAAHGGFAGVLVFACLQDWVYGKVQIALAALSWYGVLGPIAEALQHGTKPVTLTHYLNVCISASQGECGGTPPKINYMILNFGLLVAIGVDERLSNNFIIAACLVGAGMIISVVVAQMNQLPNTEDVLRGESGSGSQARRDDEGGHIEMR